MAPIFLLSDAFVRAVTHHQAWFASAQALSVPQGSTTAPLIHSIGG